MPIPTDGRSGRYDKRIANHRLRARTRQAIHHGLELFPLLDEVSDSWDIKREYDETHWVCYYPQTQYATLRERYGDCWQCSRRPWRYRTR